MPPYDVIHIWTTQSGRKIPFNELETIHLKNIWCFLARREKQMMEAARAEWREYRRDADAGEWGDGYSWAWFRITNECWQYAMSAMNARDLLEWEIMRRGWIIPNKTAYLLGTERVEQFKRDPLWKPDPAECIPMIGGKVDVFTPNGFEPMLSVNQSYRSNRLGLDSSPLEKHDEFDSTE